MGDFSYLLLIFTVYSFLGWVLETIYVSFLEGKFINRGFLMGCFCPIYGFGALLIIQVFRWAELICKNSSLATLTGVVVSTLLVTLLEYVTGYFLEKVFHCKWWDYSEHVANIKGYICLENTIIWGILTFVLVQYIHPVVMRLISSPLVTQYREYIAFVLIVYFTFDTLKSTSDTLGLRKVIIHHANFSAHEYLQKILQYKRIFLAFPRLRSLNAGILNRDVRSIFNERLDKIKTELKSRF